MRPYFYQFDKHLFQESERKELSDFLLSNKSSFIENINYNGDLDDNNYITYPYKKSFNFVIKVYSSFRIRPSSVIFLMHKPGINLVKHTDDSNKRMCVISCPLYPDNYASTKFYEMNNGVYEFITECKYEDKLPAIFNTRKIHNIENNNQYRFNIQFGFRQTFDEVLDLYLEGNLFR